MIGWATGTGSCNGIGKTRGSKEDPLTTIECVPEGSNGSEYRGTKSTTESGKECKNWEGNDPGKGLAENHNYCRNPLGFEKPFCFIGSKKFEFCEIPKCG